jgi:hypothetical protein
MKELRRLAEDHPVAAALIGAARDRRASDTLRRRTLQTVSVALPAGAGVAASAAATTASSALKLWIAASVIAGAGAAGGGAMLYRIHARASLAKVVVVEPAQQPQPRTSRAIAGRASAIAEDSGPKGGPQAQTAALTAQRRPSGHERRSVAPGVIGAASAPGTVPPLAATPASSLPAPPAAELAGELRLLDAANRALRGQAPARALAALDEYRRSFPAGALADEALVLRVTALLKMGARDQGRALAAPFLGQHPNSMLTDRLKAALSSDETNATGKETTR